MNITKTPFFIPKIFYNLVWSIPSENEKNIYLTFDDGPIPDVTEWIIELLAKYDAKATFFCVGCNVEKNRDIFNNLRNNGHAVGNHSYNHINGWQTDTIRYLENVEKANSLIGSKLFRPPYGKITPLQKQALLKDYKIIMWDVLSRDFDKQLPCNQCVQNVITNCRSGSVVVFHDSLKAEKNMTYSLPLVLDYFNQHGYTFKAIEE